MCQNWDIANAGNCDYLTITYISLLITSFYYICIILLSCHLLLLKTCGIVGQHTRLYVVQVVHTRYKEISLSLVAGLTVNKKV